MICLKHLIRSRAVTNLFFFSPQGPIFLDACATCSELPSNISAMLHLYVWRNLHSSTFIQQNISSVCMRPVTWILVDLTRITRKHRDGSDLTKIDLDPTHEKKSWIRTLTNYIHHKIHTQLNLRITSEKSLILEGS